MGKLRAVGVLRPERRTAGGLEMPQTWAQKGLARFFKTVDADAEREKAHKTYIAKHGHVDTLSRSLVPGYSGAGIRQMSE